MNPSAAIAAKAMDSGDMLLMGFEFAPKPGVDLIQNCDLPPPQKLFAAAARGRDRDREAAEPDGAEKKLELLRALRLSQTRARAAERRAAKLTAERDRIGRAFEDEARLIFCYRQSLKLLELRVAELQRIQEEERRRYGDSGGPPVGGGGAVKWVWALAICFGVVGVGFLLGYTSSLDERPNS